MPLFFVSLCLFISASLLFVIQPMVAKILLPAYGGTPAVWTVCMLFFQLLLLVAYGYVWVLSRLSGIWRWRVVHLVIAALSLLVLPLDLSPISGSGSPEYLILKNLLVQIGLPLLVIGSSAPVLQFAYSQSHCKNAADPYFLYVASNVGSLLALLSYPLVIERFSGIGLQLYSWNVIYILYLVLLIGILLFTKKRSFLVAPVEKLPAIAWKRVFFWILLSFIPCSLMLGVTFYISTDIAATPLFWVVPLALYLLSFIVTFAQKPIISHALVTRGAPFFLIIPLVCFVMGTNNLFAWQSIIANLISFFVFALFCHGELVRTRPNARQLTLFYFCLALGGVLGGLFNGIIAPRIFESAYEYPLVIILFAFVVFRTRSRRVVCSMVIVILFFFWMKPSHILDQQRNFYGIKQVIAQDGAHVLMSQSTMHGFQMLDEVHPTDGARSYYASVFPVVQYLQALYQPLRVMIIGLGTGNMACQFRKQDKLSIVEIDEQVVNIASNPDLFTYLRDCPPRVSLINDDGRIAVGRAKDASYDVLVIDAFNSDAIPVHLLTLEAFALYRHKITSEGAILVNISNRHLRVLPVLTALSHQLDMIILHKQSAGNSRLGQVGSEWALLTTNQRLAGFLMRNEGWHFVADTETRLWTDDYSNIIPLVRL